MSVDERLHDLARDARRRRVLISLAASIPIALVVVAWTARSFGAWISVAALVISTAVVAWFARRAARTVDEAWIARRLDAASPTFEDSADLLFRDAASLSPLQQLQRRRLDERLGHGSVTDIAPPWPRPMLGLIAVFAIVAILLAFALPRQAQRSGESVAPALASAMSTHIEHVQLDITPPTYTKLAPRSESNLETRVAEGSRVAWHLRFSPQPKSAALVFHDGSRVALVRSGEDWIGERTIPSATLYRIALDGTPPVEDDRLRRIDVIADRAPDVRVIQPDKSLTVLADGQKNWDLAFEASDDYGIAAANLTITLAQGTGENIAFKEQTVALDGEDVDAANPGRHLRYKRTLDLGALGVVQGDDVIVRLSVTDNREPSPNTTKSASFILRWPPEASSDSVGMEGLVQKTMPAYFRSQRQIIIDTETLIADKPTLADDKLLARSDDIGVDQKILRLRYGQFLGEEFETRSGPKNPAEEGHEDDKQGTRADALTEHEREHEAEKAAKFGAAGDVMAEYGHTHDYAEAATLLDPETKATLKSALNEMWQAELHLRQGRPAEALPFEYKSLEYIKRVQQSSRIYLARVGLELPAIDETRRLSGDRKGVGDRNSALALADSGNAPAIALWSALGDASVPDLDAFERWVHARESSMPDALSLLAASDRVRRDPACAECRRQLRDLLWPILPAPATVAPLRIAPDASGRAYLDAIGAKSANDAGARR